MRAHEASQVLPTPPSTVVAKRRRVLCRDPNDDDDLDRYAESRIPPPSPPPAVQLPSSPPLSSRMPPMSPVLESLPPFTQQPASRAIAAMAVANERLLLGPDATTVEELGEPEDEGQPASGVDEPEVTQEAAAPAQDPLMAMKYKIECHVEGSHGMRNSKVTIEDEKSWAVKGPEHSDAYRKALRWFKRVINDDANSWLTAKVKVVVDYERCAKRGAYRTAINLHDHVEDWQAIREELLGFADDGRYDLRVELTAKRELVQSGTAAAGAVATSHKVVV